MRYRRNYVEGGTYFFTVNLLVRGETLLVDHISSLREAVASVMLKKPFYIDAWVVMPDHLHAVWTLPENDADYSSRWREIKKRFSKAKSLMPIKKRKGACGVWQKRFWEHTIRDESDYRHHVDYVHINPFKHGLVTQVKDWPYSSFHRAVQRGDYTLDWGGREQSHPHHPNSSEIP